MQFLVSWKDSLRSLKWDNLKQFLSDFIQTLSRVYRPWFIYGCPAFLSATALVWFFPSFEHIAHASVLLMAGLSILFAYLFTVLFIIVQQVIHQESISLATYKKHALFLFVIMLILLAAVSYYFYPLFDMLSASAFLKQRILQKLDSLSAIKRQLWEHRSTETDALIFQTRPMFMQLLTGVYELMMTLFTFVAFFFINDSPNIQALGRSLVGAVKFILYNLPLLILAHLSLIVVVGFPSRIAMTFLDLAIAFLFHIACLLPIVITWYSQIYEQRRQADPTL